MGSTTTQAITLDHVKAEYPGICKALREEGAATARESIEPVNEDALRAEGAVAERERIQSVLAQSLPGHEALIQQLAFDGKTSGAEAAVKILQAERDARGTKLEQIQEDAPEPIQQAVPQDREPEPTGTVEERCQATWDKSAELRAEFGDDFDSFVAFTDANERGRVKLLRNRADAA